MQKGKEKEIKEKIHEFLNHRKKCHPIEFPSAGSVFVNPENLPAGRQGRKKITPAEDPKKVPQTNIEPHLLFLRIKILYPFWQAWFH